MMSLIVVSLSSSSRGPRPNVSSSTSVTNCSRSERFSSVSSLSQRCSTTRRISRRRISPSSSPTLVRSSLSTSLPWMRCLSSSSVVSLVSLLCRKGMRGGGMRFDSSCRKGFLSPGNLMSVERIAHSASGDASARRPFSASRGKVTVVTLVPLRALMRATYRKTFNRDSQLFLGRCDLLFYRMRTGRGMGSTPSLTLRRWVLHSVPFSKGHYYEVARKPRASFPGIGRLGPTAVEYAVMLALIIVVCPQPSARSAHPPAACSRILTPGCRTAWFS